MLNDVCRIIYDFIVFPNEPRMMRKRHFVVVSNPSSEFGGGLGKIGLEKRLIPIRAVNVCAMKRMRSSVPGKR